MDSRAHLTDDVREAEGLGLDVERDRGSAAPSSSSSSSFFSAPSASSSRRANAAGIGAFVAPPSSVLRSSEDAHMTSRGPSPSYRPSPSPSNTSHSDDQDNEDDDALDDDALDDDVEEDDDVFTDLASSSLNMSERRNTLKARGSAALPATSIGANSSQSWQVTPANATRASAATLPHEILLHIFKYVAHSPADLERCLLVCKAWCLCGVELLWHRPAFPKLSSLFKLIPIIKKPVQTFHYATFIRRLNLAQLAGELEDSLFKHMAACTRLERLTLAGCSRLSDETIASVLSVTKHLVAADLSDVPNLTDKSIYTIAENCQRLQGINLSNCRQLTSASVATLARSSKLLRRVKLCNCENVGDEALKALAESCPVLLEVDLVGCPQISDASVRELWKHSHHLRELRLAQCGKLTDLAFPAPASSFSGSSAPTGPRLGMAHQHHAHLNFSVSDSAPTSRTVSPMGRNDEPHSGSGDQAIAASHSSDDTNSYTRRNAINSNGSPPMHTHLRPTRMFDHLRILDLTNCSTISDAAIEGIVSNVPRIRNLILAKCTRLTNESAYSIARLGKNLHYLHLGHVSNLTDRAVCHLARSCTRLRYIDVACCPQLTDLSVMELASNLPKLRRIGLVRVMNLTDQAIYSLVERFTCLERIHLSYCENVSVPAIFWLLQRLPRLTHLSLTGVPAFRRPELQSMCRPPPKEFNAHQRQAFCVYSGKGVSELRRFLQRAYSHGSTPHPFGELTPDIQRAWADMAHHQERHNASRRAAIAARNGIIGRHLQQQQQQRQQQQQQQGGSSSSDSAPPVQTAQGEVGLEADDEAGAEQGEGQDGQYDSWFRRLQQASLFAASGDRAGDGPAGTMASATDVQRFLQEQMQIQREVANAAGTSSRSRRAGEESEGNGEGAALAAVAAAAAARERARAAAGQETEADEMRRGEEQQVNMPGSFQVGPFVPSPMPNPFQVGPLVPTSSTSMNATAASTAGEGGGHRSSATPALSGGFSTSAQPGRPINGDVFAVNGSATSALPRDQHTGQQPLTSEAATPATTARLAALATPPAETATSGMSFLTPAGGNATRATGATFTSNDRADGRGPPASSGLTIGGNRLDEQMSEGEAPPSTASQAQHFSFRQM